MSEPKRYEPDHEGLMYPTPKGNYVLMQDYVRLKSENIRLKTEVEHLMIFCNCTLIPNKELQAQVERLTKAVMHSPAAQLKLKELEGKTTFDEINPKGGQP